MAGPYIRLYIGVSIYLSIIYIYIYAVSNVAVVRFEVNEPYSAFRVTGFLTKEQRAALEASSSSSASESKTNSIFFDFSCLELYGKLTRVAPGTTHDQKQMVGSGGSENKQRKSGSGRRKSGQMVAKPSLQPRLNEPWFQVHNNPNNPNNLNHANRYERTKEVLSHC